jgi:hypothetical protein
MGTDCFGAGRKSKHSAHITRSSTRHIMYIMSSAHDKKNEFRLRPENSQIGVSRARSSGQAVVEGAT